MDHSRILKQSWKNVISYRALWIFGILLALTTGSGTGSSQSWSSWRTDANAEGILGTGVTLDWQPDEPFLDALGDAMDEAGEKIRHDVNQADRDLTRFYREVVGLNMRSNILLVLTVLLWTLAILWAVGRVVRYLSETAMIGMVDKQEQSGEMSTRREGFRMGWSRASWRLFLIDLVIGIPVVVGFLILFGVAFSPLLFWVFGRVDLGLLGVGLTSGLFFLFIFLAIIVGQAIKLVKHFARRTCVLEGTGVLDSLRRGFGMVRSNLKDVGLLWLIMVGVAIGWVIVVGVCALLLIAVATVIGGGAGVLVGMTANLLGAASPVVTGLIVGVPLFLLLLVVPLVLLDGLKEVFVSSTWTLAYRDLRALSGLQVESLPEPEAG